MRAVDTNVLVRYFTRDDEDQAEVARDVIETGNVFVPVTVILETDWVLRYHYGFDAQQTERAIVALAHMASVTVEDDAITLAAVATVTAHGLDLADALHLSRCANCIDLATFDRRFARRTAGRSTPPVTLLSE